MATEATRTCLTVRVLGDWRHAEGRLAVGYARRKCPDRTQVVAGPLCAKLTKNGPPSDCRQTWDGDICRKASLKHFAARSRTNPESVSRGAIAKNPAKPIQARIWLVHR